MADSNITKPSLECYISVVLTSHEHQGVSNHKQLNSCSTACLVQKESKYQNNALAWHYRLFELIINSPVIDGFLSQGASATEIISIP